MGSDGALDKGDAAAADAAAIASSAGAASSSSTPSSSTPSSSLFVLGLTGSIGMGKSAVASMFSRRGIPVLDADAIVRDLYSAGGAAVRLVDAAFPGCLDSEGAIDRARLGARVVGDPAALDRLNALVHPLVESERQRWLARASSKGERLAVLDVPLLFETGGDAAVDAVAVVSAPAEEQRARVLARPGMTEAKFEGIHSRQLPDAEKRGRADFVIDTGVSLEETEAHVGALIEGLRGRKGAGKWRRK
jgi:dephospho-CoA kinase